MITYEKWVEIFLEGGPPNLPFSEGLISLGEYAMLRIE
jgi:hypothetical protein